MATLRQFANRFERAINEIPESINERLALLTTNLQKNLIDATPVLTGQARTNWRVYADNNTDIIGQPLSVEQGELEALSQGRGVTKLRLMTFYLVNNAPYIVKLNRGYSKQAPTYFVQNTISATVSQYTAGITRNRVFRYRK